MSIKHDTELSFAEFNSYMHYEIMYQNLSLCDKVCQWLATGRGFSLDTSVSSTNKTDRNDITEILLKSGVKHHQANTQIQVHYHYRILRYTYFGKRKCNNHAKEYIYIRIQTDKTAKVKQNIIPQNTEREQLLWLCFQFLVPYFAYFRGGSDLQIPYINFPVLLYIMSNVPLEKYIYIFN